MRKIYIATLQRGDNTRDYNISAFNIERAVHLAVEQARTNETVIAVRLETK